MAVKTDVLRADVRWYADAVAKDPSTEVFTISTAAELAGLAAIVNGAGGLARCNFEGKAVWLAADIDLSEYENWVPIGNRAGNVFIRGFAGVFGGCGHTISNLTINRPDSECQGLFGNIHGGLVNNLVLAGVNICGQNCVGAIAGRIDSRGIVESCRCSGRVRGTGHEAGGITGVLNSGSTIQIAHSDCEVCGKENAGGLTGRSSGHSTVAHCYSAGTVSAENGNAGGVAGYMANSRVINCSVTGKISSRYSAGGVAGYASCLMLSGSRIAKNAEVGGQECVGRLVGFGWEVNDTVCINEIISQETIGAAMVDGRYAAGGKYKEALPIQGIIEWVLNSAGVRSRGIYTKVRPLSAVYTFAADSADNAEDAARNEKIPPALDKALGVSGARVMAASLSPDISESWQNYWAEMAKAPVIEVEVPYLPTE